MLEYSFKITLARIYLTSKITYIVGYKTYIVGQMLAPLLGSENSERVLIFLLARDSGYAREISQFFDSNLYAVQKQLDKLESGNVLVSKKIGRTRLYQFNPRYPFLTELKSLLEKAFSFYPEDIRENLLMNRRRPRKKDKAL